MRDEEAAKSRFAPGAAAVVNAAVDATLTWLYSHPGESAEVYASKHRDVESALASIFPTVAGPPDARSTGPVVDEVD